MSLANFKASNHPQQTAIAGANDDVDDRALPAEDFAGLQKRFAFTVDAAAASHNAKLDRFWTRDDNGLAQSWDGERIYCNPPYSDIEPWVRKAWSERGADVVAMLLPASRTEQVWWQDCIEPFRDRTGSVLRTEFLPGRMRFLKPGQTATGANNRPPFGCMLAIWNWQHGPRQDPQQALSLGQSQK